MSDTADTGATKPSDEARAFASDAADAARKFAKDAERLTGKATSKAETLAAEAVSEMARISRAAQSAAFEDTRATIDAFENIAQAATLADAAQIHIDYLSARARANVERAKSVASYLTSALGRFTKTAKTEKAA